MTLTGRRLYLLVGGEHLGVADGDEDVLLATGDPVQHVVEEHCLPTELDSVARRVLVDHLARPVHQDRVRLQTPQPTQLDPVGKDTEEKFKKP